MKPCTNLLWKCPMHFPFLICKYRYWLLFTSPWQDEVTQSPIHVLYHSLLHVIDWLNICTHVEQSCSDRNCSHSGSFFFSQCFHNLHSLVNTAKSNTFLVSFIVADTIPLFAQWPLFYHGLSSGGSQSMTWSIKLSLSVEDNFLKFLKMYFASNFGQIAL